MENENNKLFLGVRAHDLASKSTPDKVADAIFSAGFSYTQLVFNKAFSPFSYDDEFVQKVVHSFQSRSLQVVMLGAYFNPVHSNPKIVNEGIENFIATLRIAHFFNHPYVGSETGSFSDSPWFYVPKNRTSEAYETTKRVFAYLAKEAAILKEDILIEPAWGHVIYDIDCMARLFSEIDNGHVHITFDLYNLLYEGNFERRDDIFLEGLKRFGSEIKIIHLKDAKIIDGKMVQLAPGEGDFHYPLMLRAIEEYAPKAILVFEGVQNNKISFAKTYIEKTFSLDKKM